LLYRDGVALSLYSGYLLVMLTVLLVVIYWLYCYCY